MLFTYDGAYAVPGVRAEVGTYENQFWWDRREKQVFFPVLISGAARDTGNTSYTTILRSGLLLGRITSSGKLIEWTPTATDGSERIFGILDLGLGMQRLGANQDRFIGQVLVSGLVDPTKLIVPGTTALSIVGATNEYLIRAQLTQRQILMGDAAGGISGNAFGGWMDVVAKTADFTVTEALNNTLFTNRGAAGTVIFTLPTTAKKGLRYGFYTAAGQILRVTSGTADTLTVINDLTADSVGFETASLLIGNFIEVIGDGTSWLCIMHPAQTSDGTTSGALVTVAT